MVTFFVGLFTGCFRMLSSVYAILAHLSDFPCSADMSLNAFYRPTRFYFLKVLMVDFFAADQLTSQIPLMRHLESSACYFLAKSFKTHGLPTCKSGRMYRELGYVILSWPYYWRADLTSPDPTSLTTNKWAVLHHLSNLFFKSFQKSTHKAANDPFGPKAADSIIVSYIGIIIPTLCTEVTFLLHIFFPLRSELDSGKYPMPLGLDEDGDFGRSDFLFNPLEIIWRCQKRTTS
ncbi:hypothetical protein HAX54_006203 [Datura stramonium]|uniref:EXS domain-containing protein n=1 Tax=Datura stramonium TaxID=4076 RepID=A0ABS8TCB0_DATST|nr:hypothetical protein [Datura stramonium]